VQAESGAQVTLNCDVDSNPPAIIKWLQGDTQKVSNKHWVYFVIEKVQNLLFCQLKNSSNFLVTNKKDRN
jgi:hypothetical protein